MNGWINRLLDRAGDFLAAKPGVLPLFGLGLVILNLILDLIPGPGIWLIEADVFLHVGLVLAILGLLLVRPLG
jgi:hypothetical protein